MNHYCVTFGCQMSVFRRTDVSSNLNRRMNRFTLMIFLSSIINLVQGQSFNQIDNNGKRQGLWKFYERDSIRMICPFKNDLSTGTIQYFEHDKLVFELEGEFKEKRQWRLFGLSDTLVGYYYRDKGEITDSLGDVVSETLHDKLVGIFEVYPSFTGGNKALIEYIRGYPNKPKEHGKVKIQFTVGKKGEIKDAVIKESSNKKLNEFALKMLTDMPAWQPGCDAGKIIEVSMLLPFNFE